MAMIPDASPGEPVRRSDGEETHTAILQEAVRLASVHGLGSVTIGRLAQELGLSKSGVFAHFGSKQRLHQQTIETARKIFSREVIHPGLATVEGLAQLVGLCEAYLSYVERGVFPGGCFFAQLLAEFDAQTGPVHDAVAADQRGWLDLLTAVAESARRRGELDDACEPMQLAFELTAAMDLANYLSMLHRDPSIVQRGRTAVRATIARAAPGLWPSDLAEAPRRQP